MMNTLQKFRMLACATAGLLAMNVSPCAGADDRTPGPTTVMFDRTLNAPCADLVTDDSCRYTPEGLSVRGPERLVRLNRYYALAQRLVRYHVRFSADAKAVFQGDKGEFQAFVDVPNRTISLATNPEISKSVDFLNPDDEYLVEVHRDYQQARFRVIDLFTGESAEICATNDGQGGYGTGAVASGFAVGRQYDYYCFGLAGGSELLVKQVCVISPACGLTLLLYGDSITEPEGYFPTSGFPMAWTQQVMGHVPGKAVSSGRGGTTINELLARIRNELPYVKAKYVMVTIGTNGGNTEENLGELIEYIRSQGAVPILNNIPCNEHGTQIPVNEMIEKVREKYGVKGCRFDLATSVNHDGQQVDETLMWREDYGEGGVYYHHPNAAGATRMYLRTLIDVPEIYQ